MWIGHEWFENGGSVLGRHPGRVYTVGQHSSKLQTRCHRNTLLVASYDTQGNGGSFVHLPKTVCKLINNIPNSSSPQQLTDGKLQYSSGYAYASDANDMNPWVMIDLQRTLSLSEVNIVLRTEPIVIYSFGGVKVRNVYSYQSYR